MPIEIELEPSAFTCSFYKDYNIVNIETIYLQARAAMLWERSKSCWFV